MRKILLDTHAFLWWIDTNNHKLLGPKATAAISDPDNDVVVSAVTSWEISMKVARGLLSVPPDIDQVVEECGFSKLPISVFHGQQAGSLPTVSHANSSREHKDPFDRMLISQAQSEGLYLLTSDAVFWQYAVRLIDAKK